MSDIAVEILESRIGTLLAALDSFDFAPTFESMIDTFHQGIIANFDNTQAPYGQWPPHSPMTIAIHGPHPLLILTGAMKRSVTQRGADERIEEIMRNEMNIGSSLFYAPYQQFGTNGPNPIPARPFLWLESSYVDRLHEQFADDITTRIFGTS